MDLDQVEVLRHLKALGYENVEPQLLQQFIKDLKKLIKYEKKKSRENKNRNCNMDLNSESLLKEKPIILPKKCCKNLCCCKIKNNVFDRLSQPSSRTKVCSRAVSTVGVQTDSLNKETRHIKNSNILKRKQMDPVALHQYYQTEWQTHKVPGEKNHDQLRWKIKQMMIRK